MFGDLFECYCPRQIKQTVIALTCSLSFHALTYNCESTNSPFGTNSLLRCCCCKPAAHCSKSRDHVDPDAPSQSQLTVSNVTAVIKLMVNLYMLRTLCWRMPGGDSAVDNKLLSYRGAHDADRQTDAVCLVARADVCRC